MAVGETTRALVLRRVAYGDADWVITLLTEAFGKVSVMARAARKSRKRFGGALELGQVLSVRMALGRGEVGTLSEARALEVFPALTQDLERIALVGAGLELVRELVPQREPDARLFACVLEFLRAVDVASKANEAQLLAFEVRVMALVGFEPSLDACVKSGARAPEDQAAYFDPELGGVVSRAAGGGPMLLSAAARRRMRASVRQEWAMQDWGWDERELDAVRAAVGAFVGARVTRERPARALVSSLPPPLPAVPAAGQAVAPVAAAVVAPVGTSRRGP